MLQLTLDDQSVICGFVILWLRIYCTYLYLYENFSLLDHSLLFLSIAITETLLCSFAVFQRLDQYKI